MTTRQLLLFGAVVVALTLSLAWLIERRQVLSLRQELNRWGSAPDTLPQPPGQEGKGERTVGWPDDDPEGLA